MSKIIPYGKHFVDNKDINYVIRAIKNSDLTQGPMISKFEKKTGIGYRAALEGTIYLITLIITDQYQTLHA